MEEWILCSLNGKTTLNQEEMKVRILPKEQKIRITVLFFPIIGSYFQYWFL